MTRKLFKFIVAILVVPTVVYAGGSEPVGGGSVYDVTFAVTGDGRIGALQFVVDYTGASGEFVGSGQDVACTANVDALAVYNDKDSVRTLKAGLVAVDGFAAPSDVVTCRFEAPDGAPTASDFSVTVEDAAVPEGVKITPLPLVVVSSIAAVGGDGCGDGDGGSVCGNGVVEDGEECDDGDANGSDAATCSSECTLVEPCGDTDGNGTVTASDASRALKQAVGIDSACTTSACDVNESGTVTATDARMILDVSVGRDVALHCNPLLVVTLEDDVELGGLELTVDYSSAADASFVGDGDAVSCVSLLGDGGLVAFNNDSTSRALHVALVSVPSIHGPTPLFACKFHSGSAQADDVTVHVDDAITPDYATVPAPEVSVSW